MRKILVGLDGSTEARKAGDLAADLAVATGSDLLVAYVVSPPLALPPEGP